MTQLRELENRHHEDMTDLALSTLERFAKSQLEGELLDDLRTVSPLQMSDKMGGM